MTLTGTGPYSKASAWFPLPPPPAAVQQSPPAPLSKARPKTSSAAAPAPLVPPPKVSSNALPAAAPALLVPPPNAAFDTSETESVSLPVATSKAPGTPEYDPFTERPLFVIENVEFHLTLPIAMLTFVKQSHVRAVVSSEPTEISGVKVERWEQSTEDPNKLYLMWTGDVGAFSRDVFEQFFNHMFRHD
jgi:hypothetical protein